MYRILRAQGEAGDRRRQATHPPRTVPELVADAPNRVWSYDATALRGPCRGSWYDLFLMLDIFSRYCTGWMIVEGQEAQVVRDWIEGVVMTHGPIPHGTLTIHADRGPAMRSKTVAELLSDLRIGRTHSRPHVSNDNPYSEAGFKTLKYAPDFPGSFGSIGDARAFVGPYLDLSRHAG